MKISVKWFGDSFNVNIAKSESEPEFLSVKGCRIKSGSNGEFVSYPSTKNQQTGKYWNHAWGSEDFNNHILKLAKESQPQQQHSSKAAPIESQDIPF